MSGGAFAKIAGATMTGGGNNIKDGIYRLLIERVFIQDGHTGQLFIAELRVMESSANGAVDENGKPVVPNAVGTQCSLVCNLTKHDAAPGNAKKFVFNALAGLGHSEDELTPEMMAMVCSEKNPLRGVAIGDETYRTVNKGRLNSANAGKPLTLNGWKPIEQTEEDVMKARAWLDQNKAVIPTAPPKAEQQAAPAQQQAQTQPQSTPAKSGGALGSLLGLGK